MTTEKATPPGIALDNEALDRLEALARAATPGPWSISKYGSVRDDAHNDEIVHAEADCDDRRFIAAANPAAILALVAQARAAQPQPSAAPACFLNFDEMAAFRRFDECVQDGEGYDVPKQMMQRLAEIGVVQRRSGAYYQATEFGTAMLAAAPSPNFAARGAEPAGMQAAGVVEDWKTRMVKYGQTEDIAIRAEIADLRAQLSAARQGQPTAAPTPHEQEARAAVLEEAAAICDAIFKERGGVAFLYAAQEIRGRAAQAGMLPVAQTDAARDVLEPVDGDLLPPVGSKVLIHLARQDAWIEHTVAGYYVWPALRHHVQDGEKDAHRVFVRVMDAQGYDNARLLSEVKIAAKGAAGLEGGAGGAS